MYDNQHRHIGPHEGCSCEVCKVNLGDPSVCQHPARKSKSLPVLPELDSSESTTPTAMDSSKTIDPVSRTRSINVPLESVSNASSTSTPPLS